MAQVPVIGRVVTYVLTEQDAAAIGAAPGRCNTPREGDEYPAMIVRVWDDTSVNLQVFYDGDGSLWATSRPQGDGPGGWRWPVTVAGS
jgi:hypothetical protein